MSCCDPEREVQARTTGAGQHLLEDLRLKAPDRWPESLEAAHESLRAKVAAGLDAGAQP